MLEMRSSAVLSALSVLPAESQWIAYVRTVAVNLSNVRVALPSNFITTGCLNQWRRASLWSQHTVARVRRPRLVAVRRGVGCSRNVERQLRCFTCRHCACCRWCSHRPKTQFLSDGLVEKRSHFNKSVAGERSFCC